MQDPLPKDDGENSRPASDFADDGESGYVDAIARAAARLRSALDAIETRTQPLAATLGELAREAETARSTAQSVDGERADLHLKLDEATARARAVQTRLDSREAEFARLADTTEREIAAIVATVTDALDVDAAATGNG